MVILWEDCTNGKACALVDDDITNHDVLSALESMMISLQWLDSHSIIVISDIDSLNENVPSFWIDSIRI